MNDKGLILMHKEAREAFGIKAGDSLILLGDLKKGLALLIISALVFRSKSKE